MPQFVAESRRLRSSASTPSAWGKGDRVGIWASNTFLVVIKDGNANGGSTWAWFIIDTSLGCAATGNYFAAAEYCGDWTMYENKAISHMSLYGTTTASTGTPSRLHRHAVWLDRCSGAGIQLAGSAGPGPAGCRFRSAQEVAARLIPRRRVRSAP